MDTEPDTTVPASGDNDGMTEEFVPVYVAHDEMESRIVREILKDAGIPVLEVQDIGGQVYPFPVGPLAEETVAVPASRKEEAEQVLRDARASATDLDEAP